MQLWRERQGREITSLYGMEVLGSWFIPGEVMSSKNSKRIVGGSPVSYVWDGSATKMVKHKRRMMLIDSKQSMDYKNISATYYNKYSGEFRSLIEANKLEAPYFFAFQFVRKTKRKFDHHNLVQGPVDLMVKNQWLEDDDMNNMWIFPVEPLLDRMMPGVIIHLLRRA